MTKVDWPVIEAAKDIVDGEWSWRVEWSGKEADKGSYRRVKMTKVDWPVKETNKVRAAGEWSWRVEWSGKEADKVRLVGEYK
jgi:hypothetical protein